MAAHTVAGPRASSIEYEYPDCPLCTWSEAEEMFVARDRLLGQPGDFPVVRCTRCGFVFLKPRPASDSMTAYYPDTYYPLDEEAITPEAFDVAQGLLDRVIRWTDQNGRSGGCVLDVGCGIGLFLKLTRDAGFDVRGVELSQSAVDYACHVFELPVECGELFSVDLPDNTYDVITMWHVLEHLPDPVESLERVYKLLKPGGLLLFGVPNIASLEAKIFGRRWFSLDAPRHLAHFSPETARMAVRAAGLEVERIVHSDGTAGLVYSIMGDLTGVSLKLRRRELSEETYHRVFRGLETLAKPICRVAARIGLGGAIEVYARKR